MRYAHLPWRPLNFFLRVLRVLRGQTSCHHEEHEGHEVWITRRTMNARVTKIVLRSLWFDPARNPESIEGRLCGNILTGISLSIQ